MKQLATFPEFSGGAFAPGDVRLISGAELALWVSAERAKTLYVCGGEVSAKTIIIFSTCSQPQAIASRRLRVIG